MNVINELYAIRNTLNQIPVSGEESLNKMLGCIQHLSGVIVELSQPKEEKTDAVPDAE